MEKEKTEQKYIPLSEAAKKLVPYSSNYLSLRVRQGKLKGKKIGRNWYTRAEWLDEYMRVHAATPPPVASIHEPAQSFKLQDTGYRIEKSKPIPENVKVQNPNVKSIPHPSHNSAFSSHGLTKLLSASLVITILMVFVSARTVNTASRQLAAALKTAGITAAQVQSLALDLKSFDLDVNFDSLAFGINTPRVAGETIERPIAAPSPAGEGRSEGLKRLGSRLISPLYSAFNFLNPSNPQSLISRLSGSAIEAGQSLSTSTQQGLSAIIDDWCLQR